MEFEISVNPEHFQKYIRSKYKDVTSPVEIACQDMFPGSHLIGNRLIVHMVKNKYFSSGDLQEDRKSTTPIHLDPDDLEKKIEVSKTTFAPFKIKAYMNNAHIDFLNLRGYDDLVRRNNIKISV